MEFRALARLRSDARRHQINGACARACVLRSAPLDSMYAQERLNHSSTGIIPSPHKIQLPRLVNCRTRTRRTASKHHNNEAIEDSTLRPRVKFKDAETRTDRQTDTETHT